VVSCSGTSVIALAGVSSSLPLCRHGWCRANQGAIAKLSTLGRLESCSACRLRFAQGAAIGAEEVGRSGCSCRWNMEQAQTNGAGIVLAQLGPA